MTNLVKLLYRVYLSRVYLKTTQKTQNRVIKEERECALVNFWQELWNSSRNSRPLNSHVTASDALDLCFAIELAIARFHSLNAEGFWGKISEIVQSTTQRLTLLDELEKAISTTLQFNCANLRPFRWVNFPGIIQGTNARARAVSIMEFLANAPARNYTGDFLGQIYQAWESNRSKNGKGAYYTSENLARNLIQAMELQTIKETLIQLGHKKYQICDPACGSGIFFLELFRAISPPLDIQKINQGFEIHGFDLDPLAVWICRLNLVIWHILQPVQALQLIEHRDALQDNSILDKKFDFIIGNPPFFEVPTGNYPELLKSKKTPRMVNIAALFVLKYAPLLHDGGQLGFIFPRAFLFSDRWAFLRQFLPQGNYHVPRLILYNRGFARVGLEQITLFLGRGVPPADVAIVEYDDLQYPQSAVSWNIPAKIMFRPPQFSLPLFATPDVRDILERVWKGSIPLETLCDRVPGSSKPAIFRGMGWERNLSRDQTSHCADRAVKGTDIIPFGVKEFRYVSKPSPDAMEENAPPKFRFIRERPVVVCQRLVSSRTRVVAARLPRDVIPISTLTCLCLPPNPPDLSYFLVGVLNSSFASYYVADHVFLHSRLSTSLDKEYLRFLPIPNPNTLDPAILDSVTTFASRLELVAREKKEIFVRPEEMQQLDDLIFKCYGISPAQGHVLTQKLLTFWNRHRNSRG